MISNSTARPAAGAWVRGPAAWLAQGWPIAAAVCLAVLVVHGRAVGFDFVNWDDAQYVVENPLVVSPDRVPWWHGLLTPALGYPIPVTIATYRVEHALFGLDPAPFHATNVLLHALVTLLLFALLRRLGAGPRLAGGAALAFALHPAVVEPVAWVSGRKEVLASLFTLLALLSFSRPLGAARAGLAARLPAALFLLLATLSKPSAAFLPLAFAAMDRLRRGAPPVRDPGRGWVAWMVLLGIHLVLVGTGFAFQAEVGALGRAGGLVETTLRVFASAGRHATILLFPVDLAPKYLDPPGGPDASMIAAGAVVTLAMPALAVWAWRRDHPSWPGLALALLTWLPSSGVVPLNREYSDSYLYLPMCGLFLAFAAWTQGVVPRFSRRVRAGLATLGLVPVVALGAASFAHAPVYRDGVTLWTTLYARYPDSPQVCRNLGNAWMFGRNRRPERAAAVYRRCIETLGNRGFFVKNLAIATFASGDAAQAASLFREVLRGSPDDPIALKYLTLIEKREEPGWTTGP